MCDVYISTGYLGVKHLLTSFDTKKEAVDFCEKNNWQYVDEESRFQWRLEIR